MLHNAPKKGNAEMVCQWPNCVHKVYSEVYIAWFASRNYGEHIKVTHVSIISVKSMKTNLNTTLKIHASYRFVVVSDVDVEKIEKV